MPNVRAVGARSCDVLVVGCGPVGAVLALGLASRGLDVVVVDRSPAMHPLPRAVAADDEVAGLLEAVAPGCLAGAVRDVPVRFVSGRVGAGASGRVLGEVRFTSGPSGHSGLSLFSQPELEQRLAAVLEELPIEVRRGAGLAALVQDPTGVTARLDDGSAVRSRWLVGCDGASSDVRRLCGIGWEGKDLARWLVVDVEGPVDRPGLTYTCDPAGPKVDMPTPGGHRWEWLLREGEATPSVAALLAKDVDPAVVQVIRAVTYRYGARHAQRWREGRVLLAGDAAHTMPPFAGQGLGAGVRDAVALTRMLAAGHPGGYQALRAPHVAGMTRLSLLLGAVVETRSPMAAAARDWLLAGAFRAPALGPWLARGGPRTSASGVLD